MIDISKFIVDKGSAPMPGKSQYVREQMIFTCPVCGWTADSNSFLFYSQFEDYCYNHMLTHPDPCGETDCTECNIGGCPAAPDYQKED